METYRKARMMTGMRKKMRKESSWTGYHFGLMFSRLIMQKADCGRNWSRPGIEKKITLL